MQFYRRHAAKEQPAPIRPGGSATPTATATANARKMQRQGRKNGKARPIDRLRARSASLRFFLDVPRKSLVNAETKNPQSGGVRKAPDRKKIARSAASIDSPRQNRASALGKARQKTRARGAEKKKKDKRNGDPAPFVCALGRQAAPDLRRVGTKMGRSRTGERARRSRGPDRL